MITDHGGNRDRPKAVKRRFVQQGRCPQSAPCVARGELLPFYNHICRHVKASRCPAHPCCAEIAGELRCLSRVSFIAGSKNCIAAAYLASARQQVAGALPLGSYPWESSGITGRPAWGATLPPRQLPARAPGCAAPIASSAVRMLPKRPRKSLIAQIASPLGSLPAPPKFCREVCPHQCDQTELSRPTCAIWVALAKSQPFAAAAFDFLSKVAIGCLVERAGVATPM